MTVLTLGRARTRPSTSDPPLDRRLLAAWAALFLNVLPFARAATMLPIPTIVGQLIVQGSLALAFILALIANPRKLVRPNLYVVLITAMCLIALMTSPHNIFMRGSTFRAVRFAGFALVMWLLSPYWGRRDLALLRVHRICLIVIMVSVAAGAALAPGRAFSFQGRLAGVIWPIFPTEVAHFSAVLMGITVVLWMCKVVSTRSSALTLAIAVPAMLATHTRTALVASAAALFVASASLLLARSRARRALLWGGLVAPCVVALFASELTTWFLRGQSTQEASGLTGRTAVWAAVLAHPRPLIEEIFGSGMSNLSFNGFPIDSNWVGTYLDLGMVGIVIEVALLAILLVTALLRPAGPGPAVAIFLVVYCIFSSTTQTGMSGPTGILLDLAVAAAVLRRPGPER
ncbi:membrane protein [Nocardioides sp. AN3]